MEKIKSKRGFASMSPEKRAAIARMGGKAVKPENRAFSKNRALASNAGKKGGLSVRPDKRSFSTNRKLASEAGKKGGESERAKIKDPLQIDLEEWINAKK
jgi:general stress protein YciG